MNILVVSAHHDDLELGCGGMVAKALERGHRVISLVLTHSGYCAPDKTVIRSREEALVAGHRAARLLGYELIAGEEDSLDLAVTDANICRILQVIQERQIDLALTHWHGDTHPPHRRTNTMVLHACRSVPSVLGFAVNKYIGIEPFHPQLFVRLDESQWNKKIQALKCYESEFRRAGTQWVEYLDRQVLNFGAQLGVSRAEGFVVYKHLWEF
jgi:LmbE family N-acetylglucosaminyl deacetylase